MTMIPTEHQWLIDRLRERGFVAEFHQWVLGDTIQVLDGTISHTGGITCYKRGAHLVPAAQPGLWEADIGIYDDLPVSREEVVEPITRLLRDEAEFVKEWTRRRLKLEEDSRRSAM